MTDEHRSTTTRRIEIPEPIAKALAARLERSEFESIDAYAAFALELLLREIDDPDADTTHVDPIDHDDSAGENGVEDRLESLGYL